MTHYRLNEPTAYGPVPGPPVNPSREELDMTTAQPLPKNVYEAAESIVRYRINQHIKAVAMTTETKDSNLKDELIVALNGFLWLGNNLHNVADAPARFVELYEAALVGVRDLVAKAQESQP